MSSLILDFHVKLMHELYPFTLANLDFPIGYKWHNQSSARIKLCTGSNAMSWVCAYNSSLCVGSSLWWVMMAVRIEASCFPWREDKWRWCDDRSISWWMGKLFRPNFLLLFYRPLTVIGKMFDGTEWSNFFCDKDEWRWWGGRSRLSWVGEESFRLIFVVNTGFSCTLTSWL